MELASARDALAEGEYSLAEHLEQGSDLRLSFGEHRFQTAADLLRQHRQYVLWMTRQQAVTDNFRIVREWCIRAVQLETQVQSQREKIVELWRAQHRADAVEVKKLRMSTARGQMLHLPDEILHSILDQVGLADLSAAQRVCSRLQDLLETGWLHRIARAAYARPHPRSVKMARAAAKIPAFAAVSGKAEFVRLATLVAGGKFSTFASLQNEGRRSLQDFVKKRNTFRRAADEAEYSTDVGPMSAAREKMRAALLRCIAAADKMREMDAEYALCIRMPSRGLGNDADLSVWQKFCAQ